MKIGVLLVLMATATAFAVQPGFDPEDVVRHVRARPPAGGGFELPGGLDEGEFVLDTTAVYVSAHDHNASVCVAFDDTNFLLAWSDSRRPAFKDIYCARVTREGVLLDTAGIAISISNRHQMCDAVAYDGTNYLVVWTAQFGTTWDIFGARVTRNGVLLDPGGFPISTGGGDEWFADAAFDGSNYFVVWADDRGGVDAVRGTRVTPEGAVLDTNGVLITTSAWYRFRPALGFDGANYLVVWEDARGGDWNDICAARVTTAGEVLDSAGFVVSADSYERYHPALAFDGVNYLVTWADQRTGRDYDLYGTRVTPQGDVLDPTGIVLVRDVSYDVPPAIGFDGSNYLAVWKYDDSASIHAARVTPQGQVLDTNGFAVTSRGTTVGLAFGSTDFLVAWASPELKAVRVTTGGAVLDSVGIPIALRASTQVSPMAGFDGTNYLVVWLDSRDNADSACLYGIRVSPQGVALDSAAFCISSAHNNVTLSAVAFDTANFLVVWTQPDGIRGARVTRQGQVLDTTAIVIYPSNAITGMGTSAAYGGGVYVVASRRSYGDCYFVRVTPDGTVLDTAAVPIIAGRGPVVAFGGSNFLIAGERGDLTPLGIWGSRVTVGGLVLDPSGLQFSSSGPSRTAAVAFDGTNYLVAWTYSGGGIWGRRVTRGGVWLDQQQIPIMASAETPAGIVASFDGNDYVLAWRSVHQDGSPYGDTARIWGARLSSAGTVVDTSLLVSLSVNQRYGLTLAHGTGGQVLLGYSLWTWNANGTRYDADRIWGKLGPFGGIAEGGGHGIGRARVIDGASILRGVLRIPESIDPNARFALLDISGRKVMELRQGSNDVSRFGAGVYFVRGPGSGVRGRGEVRKIVIGR